MLKPISFFSLFLIAACAPLNFWNQSKTPQEVIFQPVVVELPPILPAVPEQPTFQPEGPIPAPDPPTRRSSAVLILGDSQISFGAGASYLDFFRNLEQNCSASTLTGTAIGELGQESTLAVGVRSSGLHSWVARSGAARDTVCKVDEKFGVNAGVYGIEGYTGRKYVQIGQEEGFQYCQEDQSAFEGVFQNPEDTPGLLILNFLGNAASRWANNQRALERDVRQTLEQIPEGVPCVIMTTAPVFLKATNDERVVAQARLANVVENSGEQCQVVKGVTPQTRDAIEGNPQFFRQNEEGEVIDPLHPSKDAADIFISLRGPSLCDAIALALALE